jgi:hypothetical protein
MIRLIILKHVRCFKILFYTHIILCEYIEILGPEGSPYEKGVFHLDIEVPERYRVVLQILEYVYLISTLIDTLLNHQKSSFLHQSITQISTMLAVFVLIH